MSYVLITPIKDEAENLLQLKTSILNQTLLPAIWVVVDGGSTDGSLRLAEDLFRIYEWIRIIHQQQFCEGGDSYKNMSAAINEGYECAKKQCAARHLTYSYVGKTDATPILCADYFETLHDEMERDPKLAFACGIERLNYGGKVTEVRPFLYFSNTANTDVRLYSRDFFDEIGGYPLTPCPDAVVEVKAAHNGWKHTLVDSTYYVEPRLGGARAGFWAGNTAKGRAMYELGYHPILLLLHAIKDTIILPPHYHAVPQTLGYLSGIAKRQKKIDDDEIRDYFWRERLSELLHEFLQPLRDRVIRKRSKKSHD